MREIKFRAWLPDFEKMLYSNVFEDDFFWSITEEGIKIENYMIINEMWDGIHYQRDGVEDTESILMQYTGLKDKNEKEIYDGDILSISHEYKEIITDEGEGPTYLTESFYEVIFINGAFSLKVNKNDGMFPYYENHITLDHLFSDELPKEDCELIGNIYENPELLEKIS